MKRLFLLAALSVLFACEQEEFITQRDYPFVHSIGVSDLNDTGVTVNFEILKNGNGAIDEHGLEFIESYKTEYGQNPEFYKISESGAPSSSLVTIRISNDLRDKVEYLVRPFVKSGNKLIYGENLVFFSQGVHAPVINEVSDTELTQSTIITISGQYFNQSLEYLDVRIPGLDDVYHIEILEHSSTEIKIKVSLKPYNTILPTGNFDLVVSSGGKTTTLPKVFSIVLPQIIAMSIAEGFVGQTFDLEFNKLLTWAGLDFQFSTDGIGYFRLSPSEILDNNTLRFKIGNIPPGEYKVSVVGNGFKNEYAQTFQVKNSWQVYKDNLALDNLNNWNWTLVGDEMLFWKNEVGEFQKFYRQSLDSNTLDPLPAKPNNSFFRSRGLMLPVENRYLYHGLGMFYSPEYLKDFSRFDTQTQKWERLKDFPFENTAVEKSFYFQGKIYVILDGVAKFASYDIASNSWAMTSYEVPEDLRGTLYQDSNNQGVYYVPKFDNTLYRYVPGGATVAIANVPGYPSDGSHFVRLMGNQAFLFHGPFEYMVIDMNTAVATEVQTFLGQGYTYATPWVTSKGLMLAFPREQHDVRMKVYRWIAGD